MKINDNMLINIADLSCLYSFLPVWLRSDGFIWVYVFLFFYTMYHAITIKDKMEEDRIEREKKILAKYNHTKAYKAMLAEIAKDNNVNKKKLL